MPDPSVHRNISAAHCLLLKKSKPISVPQIHFSSMHVQRYRYWTYCSDFYIQIIIVYAALIQLDLVSCRSYVSFLQVARIHHSRSPNRCKGACKYRTLSSEKKCSECTGNKCWIAQRSDVSALKRSLRHCLHRGLLRLIGWVRLNTADLLIMGLLSRARRVIWRNILPYYMYM